MKPDYPNIPVVQLFDIKHQGCMQKFCKGGGGGANLGYLKKQGAQLQAASGGTLEYNV